MKPNFLLLPLVALFSITGLISCNPFDKSDECEGFEMELKEPIIYLFATISYESLKLTPETSLENAERMIISGSIQKMYCSGKLSGYFTYGPTFYPDEMGSPLLRGGFFLPQPYQYKFDNEKDEIVIMYRAKVYMPDGAIYESREFVRRYYYSDISFNLLTMKYYFSLQFGPDPSWARVTS